MLWKQVWPVRMLREGMGKPDDGRMTPSVSWDYSRGDILLNGGRDMRVLRKIREKTCVNRKHRML